MMNPDNTACAQFAQQNRLHMRRDECGDAIIPGRRGHLYFAGFEGLCLMVIDGAVSVPNKWIALGGKLWLGDISRGKTGKREQDVKITGIPLENAAKAIRMCRIKRKRQMSPAQAEVARKGLEKAARIRESSPPAQPSSVERDD